MPYATSYNAAADPVFLGRLAEAIAAAAVAITNEAGNTPNHPARANLARQVLADPDTWAARFAVGVTSDNATGTSSTDAQLDGRVAALWNAYTTP